ncbi:MULTISPECIES: WhiB family transcriptional regulator [unclassified Micromonospora]|uniref:WhiB family transcriptional regulator n=1 Tax=unclassified Micromonospora TaxID=2617518 RepID=UPI00331DA5B1
MRLAPGDDDHWQARGVCKDYDPDLHFPIGTSGPALLQTEQAKANCRRCPVVDQCLQWALDSGEAGVWGNTTEDERRAINRRGSHVLAA